MEEDNDKTPEVEAEEAETPEADITDWEAEAKKARGIAARLRTKLTKATEVKRPVEPKKEEKKDTDELDNAALAYMATKGIEDDDEIEFVHSRMKKWDKTLREVLKDDEVLAKLKAMKIEKEVKSAMPSATKRTGQSTIDNLDYWLTKYDTTGELPESFELRSAVINAKIARSDTSKPSWR